MGWEGLSECTMYTRVKYEIEAVVEWLRGDDQALWDLQTEVLRECYSELEALSVLVGVVDEGIPTEPPPSFYVSEISATLPCLDEMVKFMQSQNRAAALDSGLKVLRVLP